MRVMSDLLKKRGTIACPRCKAPMNEVLRIAPVVHEHGLIAYEFGSCGYVTSALITPDRSEGDESVH